MYGLEPGQIEVYQRDTEALLEQTGFRVLHDGLRDRARQAGALVDESDASVRLPAALTRILLARAPAQYTIAGMTGRAWTVGGKNRHCLAIVTDPWILDSRTGKPRRPCLADVRWHTRVAQALDEVAGVSLMDYPVTDIPGPRSSLHAMEAHVLAHDKHSVVLAASRDSLDRWLRLAELARSSTENRERPCMSVGVAVLSPLTLSRDNGELLLRACAHGMPVVPTVCPMAGTTAPYSRAGVLLQANAEAVFLAAMTQVVRSGHPFLYLIGPSRTDMRDASDLYYTVDKVLWKTAGAQLGAAYGLPCGAECGGSATSAYDLQSGAEGMLFMAAAWDSGAHWLSGLGSCGNAVCMSAEMMVIQAAWLRAARFLRAKLREPAEADKRALAQRGPGGHFLEDNLTLARLRTDEFFDDRLFDYAGGHLGTVPMLERARAETKRLVAGQRSPLPEDLVASLERFFRSERDASA